MRVYRKIASPHHSCHRTVSALFDEMERQLVGVVDMSERSGINKNTFKDWRTRTSPTVDNLEAALNVLGLELTTRRKP